MERHYTWRTPSHLRWLSKPHQSRALYFALKRVFDIVVAGLLLLVLSPLMLVIALLIVLDSPGPAIFRQDRVGAWRQARGHQPAWGIGIFTLFKFRTMQDGADPSAHRAYVQAYIENDNESMAALQGEDNGVRKMVHDARVTHLGRFLRRSSLDELPQLWNVLRGDMSLVGPRPDVPYSVESYQPWHFERLNAIPGLTGLWQVSGRSQVSFDDWVRMDIEYIRNQSFWLDLKILFLTLPAVLGGRGAV
jgi:lipopolysaccharide/colanic/teichoic acid biosynthesis glycosyltransferase